ncbi:MAG TPA: hypothetical protein VIW47_09820, partial [Nitrospiraceae bacterium]
SAADGRVWARAQQLGRGTQHRLVQLDRLASAEQNTDVFDYTHFQIDLQSNKETARLPEICAQLTRSDRFCADAL